MEPTSALLVGILGTAVSDQWNENAAAMPCAQEDVLYQYVAVADQAVGVLGDGSIFTVFGSGSISIFRAYCPFGTYEIAGGESLEVQFSVPEYREDGTAIQCDVPNYRMTVTFDDIYKSATLQACDNNWLCSDESVTNIYNN